MRKLLSIIGMLFLVNPGFCENITKTISSLRINPSAVSVSVKEVQSGKEVYSLNKKTPMIPASTLKIVTSAASLDMLGSDYNFSTRLYKSTNNDLYLKLGADPFLTGSDLIEFVQAANAKNITPKNIYIDDSIFDRVEWGEGWQWDDSYNPSMPKFSAYNLDHNLLNVEITPVVNNAAPEISVKPFYPITFMNLIKTNLNDKENIVYFEHNTNSKNIVTIKGTINKHTALKLPIKDMKRYFIMRFEDAIRAKKMEYYGRVSNQILPEKNIYLVYEVNHGIDTALKSVLKNSDNLVAETLFKLAGAKYADSQGNYENSIEMVNSYLSRLNINTDDIRIADGSGVSKNNIVTSDFMTDFLVMMSKDEDFAILKENLPIPGEGTLKDRMLYFKDNMKAKTGTLADASAITGYLTTRKGKLYAFNIMINDAKTSSYDKKNIEEQILRQVYMNY